MKATWENARDGDTIGKEQAQHTPTPWKFSFEQIDPEWAVITAQGGFCVANVILEANAEFICRAVNSHADLLEACKVAAELLKTARQYFPKSMHNSAKFDLENTNATVCKAIQKAGAL